ncbi:MAG: hypothetical protein KC417_03595, partial [Myxococcales bacterium]|nr:hypothetical protein [Myxococcales bacterium]
DSTVERVFAVMDDSHFTITRPEDLPRLLAVAASRKTGTEPKQLDADALLSMGEGDALTLEVEGARRYMRSSVAAIPTRIRVRLRELPNAGVELLAEGTFEDEAKATDAVTFWDAQRTHFARNLFVSALGLSSPLRAATIEAKGATLHVRAELSRNNIELILSYLEGMIRDWAARRATAAGGTTSPSSPTSTP